MLNKIQKSNILQITIVYNRMNRHAVLYFILFIPVVAAYEMVAVHAVDLELDDRQSSSK